MSATVLKIGFDEGLESWLAQDRFDECLALTRFEGATDDLVQQLLFGFARQH